MNRKERRQTAKRLGILEYQRKLPRNERFGLIRDNIIEGRKMHEENVKKAFITREEYEAAAEQNRIYERAMKLSNRLQISLDEAVERVKQEIEKKNISRSKK